MELPADFLSLGRGSVNEILLTVRNLRELSRNPTPYILPVIPRPLPT